MLKIRFGQCINWSQLKRLCHRRFLNALALMCLNSSRLVCVLLEIMYVILLLMLLLFLFLILLFFVFVVTVVVVVVVCYSSINRFGLVGIN
jgi:hypothetical protein